jgi:hypothetical protein
MAVMCALLLAGMAVQWVWKRFKARRATAALLEDTQELDIVSEAFADYRRMVHGKTVAEILAEDSEAAEQFRRDLEADTAQYVADEFDAIRRRFGRDLRFRLSIRAAMREPHSTQT